MKYCLIILSVLLIGSCKNENKQQLPTKVNTASEIERTTTTLPKKRILFFGNSLSAGYGLKNSKDGFVGLIEKRIDSLGWNYEVVNAGLSGETSAGGLNRVDWVLSDGADVFVLELGGNDVLRGIDAAAAKQNLQAIIDKVKTKNAEVTIVLAGMRAPQNLGSDYINAFESIYPQLAKENNIALIPFLLEGVAALPSMNLADGIHPNVDGHRIVAENVWEVMGDLLEE